MVIAARIKGEGVGGVKIEGESCDQDTLSTTFPCQSAPVGLGEGLKQGRYRSSEGPLSHVLLV